MDPLSNHRANQLARLDYAETLARDITLNPAAETDRLIFAYARLAKINELRAAVLRFNQEDHKN